MSDALAPSFRRQARNPNPQRQGNDGAPTEGQDAIYDESKQGLPSQEELDNERILQRVIAWYKASRDHFQRWKQEASECYDYVAGTQWSEEDLQILRDQMRPSITFNRISPFVDTVSGLEVNNRQETQYLPRQLGAAGVNELLTGAAKWCRDECDAEDEESEAFRDAIICGVGVTQTLMEYDEDPDGLAKIVRVDPLEVLWDPSSRKQNYMDARYVLRVKDVPVETAEDSFPDFPTHELHASWAEDQPDETRQPHNARLAPYYRIDQAGEIDRTTHMCRMVEVEWWDWKTAYRTIDPTNGRFVRLSDQEAMRYAIRYKLMGREPILLKDRVKTYYKATIGDRVLKLGPGPARGGFTYKAITGHRDRNRSVWYGIVRAMRDPQMWSNKFFSQMLHILNTNAKGGLIAEEDAFVDPDVVRDAWAEADSIILLNPGGIGKVQPKNPPQFPAALPQLLQFAVEAISATSGMNMELIAQQDQNQPGVLEMQRKQQGMVVLASLFNALRRYRKEQGRLLLWVIQTFIADGRLIRIGGPDERQYVPLIHDKNVIEYDIVVDEAPTSPNMKERAWAVMVQLFPVLARLNPPPQLLAEALKYAPLPLEFVQKVAQLTQQQTMRPNAQMMVDQAKAGDMQAAAQLKQAQAHKTMMEAQLLPGQAATDDLERQARADHLRAAAFHQTAQANAAVTDQHLEQQDLQLRAHDQGHQHMMDHATHQLNVFEAMKPEPAPQPAGPNKQAA